MAYSMDLRERVVQAVEGGVSVTQVSRRFEVSRPAVRDWRDRARRDELAPGTPGPKGPIKLTEADDRLMREQVAAQPGITAKQLVPMLSVPVTVATVCDLWYLPPYSPDFNPIESPIHFHTLQNGRPPMAHGDA